MISRLFDIFTRRIDGPLMAALALTLAMGVAVVYSASGGSSADRVMGQARNLALALFALWLFAQIHPQLLMRLALPAYVAGLALLVGVALFGEIRNGARRWLHIGILTIQPSEIMKIAVPLALAWYLSASPTSARRSSSSPRASS
jgi:rod shape determining protein RodA